jgi:F-type H+-transporting ATPase subunit b
MSINNEPTPTLYNETDKEAPVAHETVASESKEGGTGSGPLAALGINPTLFAFQLINFAIVASIIWFLILKPLTKKMNERQKLIDESIDNAKKIQDNLQKSEQKFQEKIDAAKAEAGKIIDKAGVESERISAEMKIKTKNDIDALVVEAKKNLKNDRDEMVSDVKKAAAELVVSALEKVLSEKITDKKDHQLVEEMIKKLK